MVENTTCLVYIEQQTLSSSSISTLEDKDSYVSVNTVRT